MVAGDRHHGGTALAQASQGVVEQLHRFGGRNGAVVEVAGDQHRIHLGFGRQGHDPIQGRRLLLQQRGAMELAAEVPVGGVQQAHRCSLGDLGGAEAGLSGAASRGRRAAAGLGAIGVVLHGDQIGGAACLAQHLQQMAG